MLGLQFLFEINIKILICYWLFFKHIEIESIFLSDWSHRKKTNQHQPNPKTNPK